ncbi:MAG: SGNH/GDSL hydrolase family protein [Pseudorhodoplanes sp.]|nr:MAG: SGNH/GDSL hydrolase family protein [Pseudorhodoplanes sp.]
MISLFRPGAALAAGLLFVALPLPSRGEEGSANAQTPSTACTVPAALTKFSNPLPRTARRLAAGLPIKIVAIGSSSTAGAGASSPAHSYPSRLAAELSDAFPHASIAVLNQGVNGEVTRDMIARFDTAVVAENPDVVIWQVGTNAVLRDHPLRPAAALIHDGLARLKPTGADIILIDPQFAPKVLAKPDADGMVDLIALAAKKENVNLFRRFAVMRHWYLHDRVPFERFLSPDELHLNDWSYGCLAKLLAGDIAEAATRSTLTAGIRAR